MCGIVGYIGKKQAAPILLDGLSKLEYRGYDSAGMAIFDGKKINMAKATGRLKVLSELTHEGATLPGTVGIGHTRWATHGAPSDINAHPHFNEAGTIAVVHNGIIENYMKLKKSYQKKAISSSQTRTLRLWPSCWIITIPGIRWRLLPRSCIVWKVLMHWELSLQRIRMLSMQSVRTVL